MTKYRIRAGEKGSQCSTMMGADVTGKLPQNSIGFLFISLGHSGLCGSFSVPSSLEESKSGYNFGKQSGQTPCVKVAPE